MPKGPQLLTHLTIDGFAGFRSRFDDVRLAQELLEEIPSVLKLPTVMPPFLMTYYNGVVVEDCGISGFVLLRGGHLTLHTFSFRECFFADLVCPGAFDTQRAQLMFQSTFPCRSVVAHTVERGEEAIRPSRRGEDAGNPDTDFGPHLFVRFSPYRGPSTMDALFDVFDHLPEKIGMTPIMRPYVLKTKTGGGHHMLSALTMIAESHISLHIFPETNEAFFDLFSCKFFESGPVLDTLFRELGGNAVEQILTARGRRYTQLRTERQHAMLQAHQWLNVSHPEIAAKLR